jgi:hypothetical protein
MESYRRSENEELTVCRVLRGRRVTGSSRSLEDIDIESKRSEEEK